METFSSELHIYGAMRKYEYYGSGAEMDWVLFDSMGHHLTQNVGLWRF